MGKTEVNKGNEDSATFCKHLEGISLSSADPQTLDCLQVASAKPTLGKPSHHTILLADF